MSIYSSGVRCRLFCGVFIVLATVLLLVCPPVVQAQTGPEVVPVIELPLNGSVANQKISDSKTVNWYKITVNENGKLSLTLKGNVNTLGWLVLYDVNAYVVLKSVKVEGVEPGVIECHLYPGTYFVKVERSNYDWTYSLSNTLSVPAYSKDQEPNDIYQHALALDLNSTATGHIGHYSDEYTDAADWWKVTTTQDGLLKFNVEATAGAKGTLRLFDINCSEELANARFGDEGLTSAGVEYHLMPDTYYAKVERGEGAWEYSIANTFTPAAFDNDLEPNDTSLYAQTLAVNGLATGHIGYHCYGAFDENDWWKITTSQDGLLRVNIEGTTDTKGKVTLYDCYLTSQQSVNLGINDQPVSGSVEYQLKAGISYVQVERSAGAAWSYRISNSLTPKAVEEKHPGVAAKVLPLNGSAGGAISDEHTLDWWKVITTENGLLTVNFEANAAPGSHIRLFDQNGTKQVDSKLLSDEKTGALSANLKPGTYYVNVERYYSRAYVYTLSSTLEVPELPNDNEPNDVFSSAQVLELNGSGTGHIGYARDNIVDTVDWWKITIVKNGLLAVNFESCAVPGSNGAPGSHIRLFDQNGTKQVDSKLLSDEKTGALSANLKPGTYYVKVDRYYDRVYAYTLSNTFKNAELSSDIEPNDVFTGAQALPLNGSSTGHIGYYADNAVDTVDWWKVITIKNGLLTVNFEANAAPGSHIRLFDQNGTKQVDSKLLSDEKTGALSANLKPGTYYVKVDRYYDRVFAYALSTSFTKAPLNNDQEPNFHYTQADEMTLDSAVTGHMGYYSYYYTDAKDWWKVNITEPGTLTVNMMPNNKPGCHIYIYGPDGTTQLGSVLVGDNYLWPTSVEVKNLQPGTYYILISRYYDRVFSYYLTASLTTGTEAGPAVKSLYPANNETVVKSFENIGVPVLATFTKKMLPGSFTADEFGGDGVTLVKSGSFRLLDSSNRPVSATVKYTGTIASLIPDVPLENGTYTAILSNEIKDELIRPLAGEYRWTFTVGEYEEEPTSIPVTAVTLDKKTLQLTENTSETLTATVIPADATNKNVQWQSNKTNVAVVDQYGLVTAVAPGEAVITVTTQDGGQTDTCLVYVTGTPDTPSAPVAKNVAITGDTSVGSVLKGSYTFYDADGDVESGSTYRWLSSPETNGIYTEIPGAMLVNYTITAADAGKYIVFEVTPRTGVSPHTGEAVRSTPVYIYAGTGDNGDYKVWEAKEAAPDKVWTITFNLPIDHFGLKNYVYVKDSQGQKLDLSLELANGNQSVLVKPPAGGYAAGSYTLFIEKDLRSAKGIKLNQAVKMPFTVVPEQAPGAYKTNVLTHSGFDFSAEKFYGEGSFPDDYEAIDGDIIGWQPFSSGGGWDSGQVWLRTYVSNEHNAIDDLGEVNLDSVISVTGISYPEAAPPLIPGHVYVMQCKDGYVKFKVLSVETEGWWSAEVQWLYSASGLF